jgi:hypothetical protein
MPSTITGVGLADDQRMVALTIQMDYCMVDARNNGTG